MHGISLWLLNKGKSDTIYGHLIYAAYLFFVNPVLQIIINALAAFLAPVICIKDDHVQYLNSVVYFTIYLFILILMSWANNYRKEKSIYTTLVTNCLYDISTIQYSVKEDLLDTYLKYQESHDRNIILSKEYFYETAYKVCASIYQLLNDTYKDKYFKVSVFQQFEKRDDIRCIKMIQCKGYQIQSPTCYRT